MARATATLRRAAVGTETTRLRATLRALLAVPLLPLVGLLAGRVQAAIGLRGMVAGGPVQGVVFLVLLVA